MPLKARKQLTSHPKLADPSQLTWPQLSSEKEECIVGQLEKVFDGYKDCLQTEKKTPKWKTVDDKSSMGFTLSEESKQRRGLFKSYFAMGINAVFKNLEKDKLRLVIMCKTVQPSVLKNVLLTLVNQCQCPAICIPNLLLSLQKSWPGLSSATALGVLKSDKSNDFDLLVQEVDSALKEAGYDRNNMFGDTTVPSEQVTDNAVPVIGDSKEVQEAQTTRKSERTKNQPKLGPPVVDSKKYYVYKKEASQKRSFDGQEFISFDTGEDQGADNVFETVNGKRVLSDAEPRSYLTYGIRPAMNNCLEIPDSCKRPMNAAYSYGNKKAKFQKHHDESKYGLYKKMNMKKMKIHSNSNKKNKKQKKKK
ncbi:Ribonuclease P protein subunit p38 [Mactra antiquata]